MSNEEDEQLEASKEGIQPLAGTGVVADIISKLWIYPDPPELLYHYSDFSGLQGILKSGALWATDTATLNDGTECDYASQQLQSLLDELKDGSNTTFFGIVRNGLDAAFGETSFATCFCEDGDLLSMWRGYAARGGGYSLGFQGSALRGLLNPTFETFGKVFYGDGLRLLVKQQLSAANQIVKEQGLSVHHQNSIAGCLAQLFILLKHPAFKEEREWRFVIPSGPAYRKQLNFRAGEFNIKPYLTVPVTFEPPDSAETKSERLPLKKIVIGPTLRSDETEKSLRWMLEKYGYGSEVEIVRSLVPYRY